MTQTVELFGECGGSLMTLLNYECSGILHSFTQQCRVIEVSGAGAFQHGLTLTKSPFLQ